MKRFSLLMLVALFLMISTLGCNTIKGAGKDIENAGEGIQKTMEK
jgi:predicted small secreted protein